MSSRLERGRGVAALLEGTWRRSPPPVSCHPPELAELAPLLLSTGAGALTHWRLRHAGLASLPEAAQFHQAYRHHALEGALHERRLPQAFVRLRAAGIEPILGKGWAAARYYPETGLRPYGDIDLFVPAPQHAAAAAALRGRGTPLPVDLHCGFADLDDRDPKALVSRSLTFELEGVPVRVFGAEDHLRLVSLHALRHGLARALWLCDVAALVEQKPGDFDWGYLFQGAPRRSEAVACALGLAGRLLGARLDGASAAMVSHPLPSWLEPAVLRQWGSGSAWRRPIEGYLRQPVGALRELPRHWPNPVAATVGVGAPFNELPRLPFQIAYAAVRLAGVLRRISRARTTERRPG